MMQRIELLPMLIAARHCRDMLLLSWLRMDICCLLFLIDVSNLLYCNISSSLRDYKNEVVMGKCLKGESEVNKKDATFVCEKCGAKTDNKSHLCEPKKIKSKK